MRDCVRAHSGRAGLSLRTSPRAGQPERPSISISSRKSFSRPPIPVPSMQLSIMSRNGLMWRTERPIARLRRWLKYSISFSRRHGRQADGNRRGRYRRPRRADRGNRRAPGRERRPKSSRPRACMCCPASSTPRCISASPATSTRKIWKPAAAPPCWAASPPCSKCPTPIRPPPRGCDRRQARAREGPHALRLCVLCRRDARTISARWPSWNAARRRRRQGVSGLLHRHAAARASEDDILGGAARRAPPHGGAFGRRRPAERAQGACANAASPPRHPVWRDVETARALHRTRAAAGARRPGRRLHVLHVTTADELPLLAAATDFATAETTPQHLTLAARRNVTSGWAPMRR